MGLGHQPKLKPAAQEPEHYSFSSLIVTREKIPPTLGDADKRVLRANLESHADGQIFFFRDCPEVRRVLRMK